MGSRNLFQQAIFLLDSDAGIQKVSDYSYFGERFSAIFNNDITDLWASLCGGLCNHHLHNNVSNRVEQLVNGPIN